MRSDDLYSLPPDLPVPVDDGACDHLSGVRVPAIALPSTLGGTVRLDRPTARWTVVYAYPRTGQPTVDSPPGWDQIPGARGCTPQNCAYRDLYHDLVRLGAEVYGLSTQTTDYQREMAERLHLPYPVFPSNADSGWVIDWLGTQRGGRQPAWRQAAACNFFTAGPVKWSWLPPLPARVAPDPS